MSPSSCIPAQAARAPPALPWLCLLFQEGPVPLNPGVLECHCSLSPCGKPRAAGCGPELQVCCTWAWFPRWENSSVYSRAARSGWEEQDLVLCGRTATHCSPDACRMTTLVAQSSVDPLLRVPSLSWDSMCARKCLARVCWGSAMGGSQGHLGAIHLLQRAFPAGHLAGHRREKDPVQGLPGQPRGGAAPWASPNSAPGPSSPKLDKGPWVTVPTLTKSTPRNWTT